MTRNTTHGPAVPGPASHADLLGNLIIDRYETAVLEIATSTVNDSRTSVEDAVTWNIFRSLRQVDAAVWLPELCRRGLPAVESLVTAGCRVSVWPSAGTDTGSFPKASADTHIDALLESSSWVWMIQTEHRSHAKEAATLSDAVRKLLDWGSRYADERALYFSVLVCTKEQAPAGVETVGRYADLSVWRTLLAEHPPSGLPNLKALTILTWSDLATVLGAAVQNVDRADERGYAARALAWMHGQGLLATQTVP